MALPNVVSDNLQVAVDRLIYELDKSVCLQVQSIPQRKYVLPVFSFSITSYYDKSPGKARIAILFSGGIDSTALCYFADRYSSFLSTPLSNCYNRHIPKDEPIDLLNVAFENPRKIRVQLEGNPDALSKHLKRERRKFEQNGWVQQYSTPYLVPDRIGGLEELEELQKVCPGRIWNFVGCNVPVSDQLSD